MFLNVEKRERKENEKRSALLNLATEQVLKSNVESNKKLTESKEYTNFIEEFKKTNETVKELEKLISDREKVSKLYTTWNNASNAYSQTLNNLAEKTGCYISDNERSIVNAIQCVALENRREKFSSEMKTVDSYKISSTLRNLILAGDAKSLKDIEALIKSYNSLG